MNHSNAAFTYSEESRSAIMWLWYRQLCVWLTNGETAEETKGDAAQHVALGTDWPDEFHPKTLNNTVLIPFCLRFAANVDARESAGYADAEKRKHFFFSIPATWFYLEKAPSLPLIYWPWTNLAAWQYTASFLMTWTRAFQRSPKTFLSFHSFNHHGIFFTPHSHLHVLKAFGAVRLRPICRIDCHTKREQMVHLS